MGPVLVRVVLLVLGLGLAEISLAAAPVLAHGPGGEEATIEIEPATLTAGGTLVLAGSGLEPNAERVVVLAGQGLVVEYGKFTTDAEGMLRLELTVPSHLPGGVYQVRAIGDETLTADLQVTAASGQATTQTGPGEDVAPRPRSPFEAVGVLAAAALLAGIGAALAVRGDRQRRAGTDGLAAGAGGRPA